LMLCQEVRMAKSGVTFEVDDSKLRAMLKGLSPAASESAMKDVLKQSSRLLLPMARREASSNGLGKQGRTENDGWEWTRLGRIPRAISGGKVYRVSGAIRTRLYIKAGRKHGLMGSAPHANPVIAGYRQWVPNGKPGAGQGRFVGSKPGRSVFGSALRAAPNILDKAVLKVIDRIVARARRKHGG
jgi:hypothetical protein